MRAGLGWQVRRRVGDLRHLLLELRIAAFQVITDLVWLYLLLIEDLAQGALGQVGETVMPLRRPMFTRMAGEKARWCG
jgi:hypothetical protein